jgi:hypothetical protein
VDVTKADLQRYAETYLKELDGIALAKQLRIDDFLSLFSRFLST